MISTKKTEVIGGFGEKKSNGGSQWYQQDRVYTLGEVALALPSQLSGGGSYMYLIIEEIRDEHNSKPIHRRNLQNHKSTVQSDRSCKYDSGGTLGATGIMMIEEKEMDDWIWEINGKRYRIRIRKLIPKECFRLMDFTDEDFEKVENLVSDTQKYKQAGNSIVVRVAEGIIGNIFQKNGKLKWEE